MSHLALFLLGPPRIERDGESVEINRRKAIALLAYLAVTRVRHTRDALATLFWPESDQKRARAALRKAVSVLKRNVGTECLEIERERLALKAVAGLYLDVGQFRERLEERYTHGHPADEICPACLALLTDATSLYRDDFMAGFTLRDSPGFDEWQFFQREELRRELNSALEQLVRGYNDRGEFELSITYARRWLTLDPLHEPVNHLLMQLYTRTGQRAAALRQYQEYVRVLQQELGLPPQEETIRLYETLQKRRSTPPLAIPQPPARPLSNLPLPVTPFVGRKKELSEIKQLLKDPACRLLTLVGPGGIGKTYLALQATAEQSMAFADGVHFVPLAPLGSANLLVPAIADVIKFSFHGGDDPKALLLNYLCRKEMLLVMDNFEHLVESAGLVTEILQTAPAVRILVTSRERLNLRVEWVFDVQGLRFPPDGEAEEAQDYSAVQLFLQSARRIHPNFSLSNKTASVVHLCQLVEGMPLAIELASSWVRVLPCEAIASEIERNFGFLTSSLRDVPERHRSVRAIFDHSWRILSDKEREICCRLSVFRGGFTRLAAESVTGASLPLLSGLMDKSLLRWDPVSERYDMHKLVQQYTAEKLAQVPDVEENARNWHSQYWADFLHQREPALKGRGQEQTLRTIGAEVDNVRHAWGWAVEQAKEELIEQCLESLFCFYNIQSRFREGEEIFAAAIESLRRCDESTERTHHIIHKLLIRQGVFLFHLGRYDEASKQLRGSLDDLALLGDRREMAFCLSELASIMIHQGERDEAGKLAAEALVLARATQSRDLEADCLNKIGQVCRFRGDYESSKVHFRQALRIYHQIGNRWGESATLTRLGNASHQLGDYAEAIVYRQRALRVKREIGDRRGEGMSLLNLGAASIVQGDYVTATSYCEQALHISHEIGDRVINAAALHNLGWICCNQGSYDQARNYYGQVLEINLQANHRGGEAGILDELGCVFLRQGDYARAKVYLEQALCISREIGAPFLEGYALANLSLLHHHLSDDESARNYACQAIQIAQEHNIRPLHSHAVIHLGHAAEGQGDLEEAARAYGQSRSMHRELGKRYLAIESLAGMARVALGLGCLDEALLHVEEILSYLQSNSLDGTEEPLRVYLTCYRVLRVAQDPRARDILETAYCILQTWAANISDEQLRLSFLENVLVHREILDEFTRETALHG